MRVLHVNFNCAGFSLSRIVTGNCVLSVGFILFLVFSSDVSAQKTTQKPVTTSKKPESVKDLFNTSSCIPKPYVCPHKQIQFYLYTRRTQNKPELLDTTKQESLYNSFFNRAHPTKIVVHGFGGGRNLSPSTDMREAYFYKGNYNIIIVDYGTLVREPCLKQMEWAPRFCAKCIAQLVRYLSQHPRGLKADDLHLVGYSIGAHILGLVANYMDPIIDGKLGRITGKWKTPNNAFIAKTYKNESYAVLMTDDKPETGLILLWIDDGLDPTIVFYMGSNRSRDLDHTDAHFVDIIHTGAGVLGQWGPNGHADFYVNGGSSQPGCASDTVFKTLACDHTKVTPYFIESIVTKKGFYAYPCPSLFSFMVGWCEPKDNEYVLMGENVSHKARGVYYLTTNPTAPFAQGHPNKNKNRRRSIVGRLFQLRRR